MTARRTIHSGFGWNRTKGGGYRDEYFVYFGNPSELAQELWNYVISIGKHRRRQREFSERARPQIGYVLHYVCRGRYWHRVGGRTYQIGPGEVCFLDLSKQFAQGSEQPVVLWWIHFNGKDLPHLFVELGADRDPVFTNLDRQRSEALFRELWGLIASKPLAHEARVHAVLATILAELFASRARCADLLPLLGRRAVLSEMTRMALDFIARMYEENIGLKQIAAAVGLSLHYFSRKFHQEVGMAPIQYLNHYRVEQAKLLLTSSDRPVELIARMVGIPDGAYFSRLFRRLTGESPLKYRKKQKTAACAPSHAKT